VLEVDPRLDRVDAYGRLLRYVRRGGVNVNLELVRRGAATVWLYGGERGRYAGQLLGAARSARSARRGIWGACLHAVWNPLGPATTGPGSGGKAGTTSGRGIAGSCDPSYPTVCISRRHRTSTAETSRTSASVFALRTRTASTARATVLAARADD
jgi:hypothetical protein